MSFIPTGVDNKRHNGKIPYYYKKALAYDYYWLIMTFCQSHFLALVLHLNILNFQGCWRRTNHSISLKDPSWTVSWNIRQSKNIDFCIRWYRNTTRLLLTQVPKISGLKFECLQELHCLKHAAHVMPVWDLCVYNIASLDKLQYCLSTSFISQMINKATDPKKTISLLLPMSPQTES